MWHFPSFFAASELDSIKALFTEKEKELSVAVSKVEELTKQLDELRKGSSHVNGPAKDGVSDSFIASNNELDKLRKELLVSGSFRPGLHQV